jgi:chromosome segregation ATPase
VSLRNKQDAEPERERLADELAGLRAEIKALRAERDDTEQLTELRRSVEELKLEKARLVEDNARKIRETEHKVGLLKTKQDHEVANARRETELKVREGNLAAEKKRFEDEMTFQREHMQREVDRFDGIAKALMERLPVIEVELSGPARTASRKT